MVDYWAIQNLATRTLSERRPEMFERRLMAVPMGRVVEAMEEGKDIHIGPVDAYVVNFSTKQPHPYKFCHLVCEERMTLSGGLSEPCRKSLQPGRRKCDHDSVATGNYNDDYKFDVLLSDAVYNGDSKPIWCKITGAAATLLSLGATTFSIRSEKQQFEIVRDLILRMPRGWFSIQVKKKKAKIVDAAGILFPVLNFPRAPSGRNDGSASGSRLSSTNSPPSFDVPGLSRTSGAIDIPGNREEQDFDNDKGPEASHVRNIVAGENQEPDGVAGEDEEPDGGLKRNNATPFRLTLELVPPDPIDKLSLSLRVRLREKLESDSLP